MTSTRGTLAKTRAFSLLELLVVIAIVLILAAIILVAAMRAMKYSKDVAGKQSTVNIHAADP